MNSNKRKIRTLDNLILHQASAGVAVWVCIESKHSSLERHSHRYLSDHSDHQRHGILQQATRQKSWQPCYMTSDITRETVEEYTVGRGCLLEAGCLLLCPLLWFLSSMVWYDRLKDMNDTYGKRLQHELQA